MYEIKADQTKNRLYITLTGTILSDEVKSISESIVKEVEGLSVGFACIADLAKFKMKPESAEWLLHIHDLLSESGMSEMISVGDPMYRELLEKNSRKAGYSGKLVYDLETAIRIVEQRE